MTRTGRAGDFPARYARSQRFTRGRPRNVVVSPDGRRVWFLSSTAGEDGVHHLFLHTVADGTNRRVVDAGHGVDVVGLTDAERARRERLREGGGGIVAHATDHEARRVALVLDGQVLVVDADGGRVVVTSPAPMFDPRLSPDGRRLAGVVDGALYVAGLPEALPTGPDGTDDGGPAEVPGHRVVGPGPDEPDVTWGLAEFVAAEEMGRQRGFWFAGDGAAVLVARVDEGAVARVHLADPIEPTRAPRSHRYPFAGTANAVVDLHLLDLDEDGRVVANRRVAPPPDLDADYLVSVRWDVRSRALVTWQDRAQTRLVTGALAADRAEIEVVADISGQPWVEPVPGAPRWVADSVLTVEDRLDLGPEGTRAVVVDGRVRSPAGLQVRQVVDVDDGRVVVRASRGDPTTIGLHAVALDDGTVTDLTTTSGVHQWWLGGGTRVESSATMETTTTTVSSAAGSTPLPDHSLDPGLDVEVSFHVVGSHGLHGGLVVPDGDGPFPVLLDPYGGPHAQRVLRARSAWLVPAWFARQGYAVLVVDNRGSPGRSPRFEHAIRDRVAEVVLADQLEALAVVAEADPRLDLDRVAIRGWSFGGLLAGLAALRRPDVVKAAIVGAPVTDQRLYDTHYTERYLGHPDLAPEAYRASSLVDAEGRLVQAIDTDRPPAMLLIHGLVDDNVLSAHALRLSRALLEQGRPHQFLPLSGVSHMTPQEEVSANLLRLQRDFLDRNV